MVGVGWQVVVVGDGGRWPMVDGRCWVAGGSCR